ncbi:hypothetical protein [Prosthecochloris aestuarii]|uniref:hypothetical protein n=1 Tax=Prosthecochloris aestuarii TaxID=1102 RepID=UPI00123205F3|nr:hypothetical protein [Prosthecochloris aestuarii]
MPDSNSRGRQLLFIGIDTHGLFAWRYSALPAVFSDPNSTRPALACLFMQNKDFALKTAEFTLFIPDSTEQGRSHCLTATISSAPF